MISFEHLEVYSVAFGDGDGDSAREQAELLDCFGFVQLVVLFEFALDLLVLRQSQELLEESAVPDLLVPDEVVDEVLEHLLLPLDEFDAGCVEPAVALEVG